ncbi:MAG: hypothetical protein ACXV9R_04920 [Methylobacter sp.]
MPRLFSKNIGLTLSLMLMTGCAELNPDWNGNLNRYNDPYAQSDFDELMTFGANMAKISPSSRADVCHTLLKRQKNPPGSGIHLHLMVGRLVSDSCGDIGKILDGIGAIPPGSFPDERMQRLIAIDTEALKHLQNAAKKAGTPERKQKSVQPVLESKDSDGSKKNETRLLREKLDAIRSMEKHLDESGDAN